MQRAGKELETLRRTAKGWWRTHVWMKWMRTFETGQQVAHQIACAWQHVNALWDWPHHWLANRCPRMDFVYSTTLPCVRATFLARMSPGLLGDKICQFLRTVRRKVLHYGVARAKNGSMLDNWTLLCPLTELAIIAAITRVGAYLLMSD